MKLTAEQLDNLASELQGTTLSLEEGLSIVLGEEANLDDMDLDDCFALDNLVFMCASCNWWYEAGYWNSQKTDENYCLDCEPEDEES